MIQDLTKAIALTVLWSVFALVCLGLWFSAGRGPLLHAKLRLGGLLIAMSGIATTGSACWSCYDYSIQQADSGYLRTCADESDNDGDGWVDKLDPDCQNIQGEQGFSDRQCNDDQDNDEDGLIDADDPDCLDGLDDDESR